MKTRAQHAAELPIVVLGAGPVGLTAAAHLLSRRLTFLVLERGPTPGAHVLEWSHVRMFSPWRYNIDPVVEGLLRAQGWARPDLDHHPTGAELQESLLLPLATLPDLAGRIHTGAEALALSRVGADRLESSGRESAPFVVRVRGADGSERDLLARAVIDATGTLGSPRPLGAHGLPALGETRHSAAIHYGIPDLAQSEVRRRYAGRRVAVVGGGDSAFNALTALAGLAAEAPDTTLAWVLRGAEPRFGGGAADALPERAGLASAARALLARGALTLQAGFAITAVESGGRGVQLVAASGERLVVDEVICLTGYRPDLELLAELRLTLDPATEAPAALGPLIDPNLHSCGTVPPHGYLELSHAEPGLFVVGMKSYGRAPTFLLRTGYEQVRSVVAGLAGDLEAARTVQLELPETGVCSGGFDAEPAVGGVLAAS